MKVPAIAIQSYWYRYLLSRHSQEIGLRFGPRRRLPIKRILNEVAGDMSEARQFRAAEWSLGRRFESQEVRRRNIHEGEIKLCFRVKWVENNKIEYHKHGWYRYHTEHPAHCQKLHEKHRNRESLTRGEYTAVCRYTGLIESPDAMHLGASPLPFLVKGYPCLRVTVSGTEK